MTSAEKLLEPYKYLIRDKNTEMLKKCVKSCGNGIAALRKEIKESENTIETAIQEKKLLERELRKILKAKNRKK